MESYGTKDRPWPIAVSDLDFFEGYLRPDPNKPWEENITKEDVIKRMNREEKPSIPMKVGTAFHKAIEEQMILARRKGDPLMGFTRIDHKDYEEKEHFIFTPKQGFRRVHYKLKTFQIVEQDVEKTIKTDAGWVTLRGKIDGLCGKTIVDLKTCKRFNADMYTDSWQWKAYLYMAGPEYRNFCYASFQIKYPDNFVRMVDEQGDFRVIMVDILEDHQLTCWRYPAMEQDLRRICGEAANVLGLLEYEPKAKREMEIF